MLSFTKCQPMLRIRTQRRTFVNVPVEAYMWESYIPEITHFAILPGQAVFGGDEESTWQLTPHGQLGNKNGSSGLDAPICFNS